LQADSPARGAAVSALGSDRMRRVIKVDAEREIGRIE